MSNPTLLSNLLKNAQTVTSMASTDRLAVIDNAGELKKADRNVAVFGNSKAEKTYETSASRWVTISENSATTAWGGILVILTGLWAGYPNLHIFAVGSRYASGGAKRPVVESLLGTIGDIHKVKLRVILNGDKIRLDVYCLSKKIEVYSLGNLPLLTPEEAASIPAGATTWEYDFTNSTSGIVGGGVNNYPLISYVLQRKEGGMSTPTPFSNSLITETLTDGLVKRASPAQEVDLNTLTQTGFYVCNKPLGLPASTYRYGLLVVINGSSRILQAFFPDASSAATDRAPIFRMKIGSTTDWGSWYTFAYQKVE